MSEQTQFLLSPAGRFVGGSLYDAKMIGADGKPLIYREGPKAGQPRPEFYVAFAIPKNGEKHWSETSWGTEIFKFGHAVFQHHASSPNFAWKITDGDSTVANSNGIAPVSRIGYARNWVLHLGNGFPPTIHNRDGSETRTERDYINLGDYIQVYIGLRSNESKQNPGIHLNVLRVALLGYGERINLGVDPREIGFGKVELPHGASPVPYTAPNTQIQKENVVIPASNPEIVDTSSDVLSPDIKMTEKAQGRTYQQMIDSGFTYDMLKDYGFIEL